MRIALATCADLPDWEKDDRTLWAAFEARGVELAHPAWDDPEFDWGACDACLIRTAWDYEHRRDEFVAWARRAAAATRLFNSPEIVEWNTHKSYLRDLGERGVPLIPTVWLGMGESGEVMEAVEAMGLEEVPEGLLEGVPEKVPEGLLEEVLAERGWRRAFLKPLVGQAASATLRFAADAAGLEAARRHLAEHAVRGPWMLQPYLARVEREGELSAIFVDGELTHAVRKVPVPGDYRVQDDFGASDERIELAAEDRQLAHAIVDAVGAPDLLYARVDLLRDDEGRLRLTELELVEPSMFFRHAPEAAERLAEAVLAQLSRDCNRGVGGSIPPPGSR